MDRSYDRVKQTAGRLAFIAVPALVALTATGCGENDPGDPVSVARDLASPIPSAGRVDVYCSPSRPLSDYDRPEECSIDLKVAETTSMADAETWLIAVGHSVGPSIGHVFTFDSRRFFWSGIFIERLGSRRSLDYVCGGVVRPIYYVPGTPIAPGTVAPLPATSAWFTNVADARAAGCRLAVDDPSPESN
jgi:hypothetical protein